MKRFKSTAIRICYIVIMVTISIVIYNTLINKDFFYYTITSFVIIFIGFSLVFNFTLTDKEKDEYKENGDYLCDC